MFGSWWCSSLTCCLAAFAPHAAPAICFVLSQLVGPWFLLLPERRTGRGLRSGAGPALLLPGLTGCRCRSGLLRRCRLRCTPSLAPPSRLPARTSAGNASSDASWPVSPHSTRQCLQSQCFIRLVSTVLCSDQSAQFCAICSPSYTSLVSSLVCLFSLKMVFTPVFCPTVLCTQFQGSVL